MSSSLRTCTASARPRGGFGVPARRQSGRIHEHFVPRTSSPLLSVTIVNASSSDSAGSAADPPPPSSLAEKLKGWWKTNQDKSRVVKEKLMSYGPAAVLAYGLFDGVSYSIAFAIAFLGYEAQTGLNPCANISDLVRICVLMWAGNNVTRPFRLAGAAALAPFVDSIMEKLQAKLRLPNKLYSFFILTFFVAAVCLGGIGLLIFSRFVQG